VYRYLFTFSLGKAQPAVLAIYIHAVVITCDRLIKWHLNVCLIWDCFCFVVVFFSKIKTKNYNVVGNQKKPGWKMCVCSGLGTGGYFH
jgi:hypothetical protein